MRGVGKAAVACRRYGMRAGLQRMFSRVLWTQKMREHCAFSSASTTASSSELDPVFPARTSLDEAIVQELVDGGRTKAQAVSVLSILLSALERSAKAMKQSRDSLDEDAARNGEVVTLSIPPAETPPSDFGGTLCELAFRTDYRHLIRYGHLVKLQAMFKGGVVSLDEATFLRRVYCVLARYSSLSAGGSVGYRKDLFRPNL